MPLTMRLRNEKSPLSRAGVGDLYSGISEQKASVLFKERTLFYGFTDYLYLHVIRHINRLPSTWTLSPGCMRMILIFPDA